MVYCPACEADLDLDEEQLEDGGVVTCGDCGANFEIVNLHPLELNPVGGDEDDEELEEDDEDFDDDEDDEDEDDEEGDDLDDDEDLEDEEE